MARTPLFAAFRRALRLADLARRTGRDPAELAAAVARRDGPSRRQVLGGALGAAAVLPLWSACGDNDGGGRRVAVVGGGAAGLHCARHLVEAGIDATVYEASGRTGGRMFTRTGLFPDGKVVELGGELIDTDHAMMRGLAESFELTLDDLVADTAGLRADTYHFDGAAVDDATIVAEFTPLAARMATAAAAGEADETLFAQLDAMSISAWLAGPGMLAPTSLIRRILEMAYTGEYGLAPDQQSVWNLLWLIDYDEPDPFRIYGDSDERFHLREGSQAIPDALARGLTGRIELEHQLVALAQDGNGYRLTFDTAGGTVEVDADRVVLALPFTTLREVDLAGAGLSADKQAMIDELGYGTNAKLMLGFTSRPWRSPGQASGSSVSDVGALQATWDTSRGYPGTVGVLTNFVGGARGLAIGDGTAEERAAEVLPWLDTVFPGSAAAYMADSAIRQHWPTAPFHKGSYACYRPGQAAFAGAEGVAEGGVHFAGEHTSVDFQGYMEGAIESGLRAAEEVLAAFGLPLPSMTRTLAARRRSSSFGRGVRRRRRS